MPLTIVLSKEDIHNPLHPYLWDTFLEQLGLDEETEEIVLERSLLDHNRIRVHPLDKRNS